MKCIDLTGQRFSKLTVIERVENYETTNGKKGQNGVAGAIVEMLLKLWGRA